MAVSKIWETVIEKEEEKSIKEGTKPEAKVIKVPVIEMEKLPDEGYNPNRCIVSTDHPKPKVILPDTFSIDVIREDVHEQGLDDLADLEEDLDNLHFSEEQSLKDVQIEWWSLNNMASVHGWTSSDRDLEIKEDD
ncbi:hypothetical protein CsSME_00053012 [Camellia sinensis var. sinensis]